MRGEVAEKRRVLREYRKRLAAMGVDLVEEDGDLPDGVVRRNELAVHVEPHSTVYVKTDSFPGQLRSTLEHECVHVELGHGFVRDGTTTTEMEVKEAERIADYVAARRLMPIGVFAPAFLDALDDVYMGLVPQIARALGLDQTSVGDRLRTLSGTETGYIKHLAARTRTTADAAEGRS